MEINQFTCPSCGAAISVEAGQKMVNCDYCGRTLRLDDMTAGREDAGYEYEKGRIRAWTDTIKSFVPEELMQHGPSDSDKSKLVALVLCLCGGFFGIHHFYAGRIGMGILYICTFGLFGIGWLVDLIFILCNRYQDGNHHYITRW